MSDAAIPEGTTSPEGNGTSPDENRQNLEPVVEVVQVSPPPPKKKGRISKKEIPDYDFSDDQEIQIVEYIKANPLLYNKGHRHFSHNRLKCKVQRIIRHRSKQCGRLIIKVRNYVEGDV